ncbi:hypothetical protein PENSUB_2597 [Penicillium subrubescens]|uniref:Uncharacterized protein n=1 Tax=Penicillium subrubescens TaxID=1316194 RepID=A0A1Q5UHB3_9EURO|nr:hypothetical protein PENSUB_2597 [Penicillium subrubescens]
MTTNHDTDTSEDDGLMAQANEPLKRELLQSQKLTLTTYRAPRRVVSLGISPSYVKDWMPADAFRELYQNWYTPLRFLYCDAISENQVDRVDRSCPRHGKPTLPCAEAVVIGATRAKSGRPVALDAFVDWLRLTTMDIRGLTCPSGIISSPHGDLILDPQLRGQLYHNGITLANSTVGGAFLFAYNFAYSSTCRDRRRLASWRDAARQVQQIWEEALCKQVDTILPLLVDLLRNHARSADAEMIGPHLEPSAARQIWQYLLRESADKEFFYNESCNDQTTNMIRDNLGKRPARLPDTLWHMLRAHCPIRTVEEEQQKLFKDAKPCVVPDTTFARTVDCALRACFALLSFTDHIQVFYVRGSAGKVDAYFDKGQAHPTSRPAEIKFMRQIGRRLRYLLHSIKLEPYPRGILVSWEDNETESVRTLGPSGPDYHVVLHDDNCANAETALLHDKAALPSEVVPCGCRQQFARQTHRMCLFTGLSHTSTYYAMIALNEDRAFYGVPSNRLLPGSYEKVENISQ